MLIRQIDRHSTGNGITWFEVIGHTGRDTKHASDSSSSYLYEYGWTLGYHLASPPNRLKSMVSHVQRLTEHEKSETPPSASTTTAHVRLFLPTLSDWLVTAHTATVKHLSPVEHEEQWRQRLAADWNDVAPIVGAAGQLAADVTTIAPIGAVAKAVAGLRATSVPQTSGSHWFVRSIDLVHANGVLYQGVEWELPRSLLAEVGTRISGSLLVSFVAARTKNTSLTARSETTLPILADAALSDGDHEIDRVPPAAKDSMDFVELDIAGQISSMK